MRIRGVVAGLVLAAVAGGALAQGEMRGDVIAERRAGLKRMGEYMEAFKPVADSRGDPRPLAGRIDEMIAWYRVLPSKFPPGSGTGDTKARPEIWQDFPRFEQANATLLGQLEVLRTAAANGDAAGFAEAYRVTGPQFCGGCHRNFRAR